MEAVTSLISAGADVNDVNQVRHGVCSVSPHTWSDGLVCDVSLHMSVITQYGWSALILAARWGRTEVVSLLVKAGAALDLQDKVNMWALIQSLNNAVCDSDVTLLLVRVCRSRCGLGV